MAFDLPRCQKGWEVPTGALAGSRIGCQSGHWQLVANLQLVVESGNSRLLWGQIIEGQARSWYLIIGDCNIGGPVVTSASSGLPSSPWDVTDMPCGLNRSSQGLSGRQSRKQKNTVKTFTEIQEGDSQWLRLYWALSSFCKSPTVSQFFI